MNLPHEIIEKVEQEIQCLAEEAKALVDEVWQTVLLPGCEEGGRRSNLGIRTRLVRGSISIEWYYNKWYKLSDGTSKPLSKYIRRGTAPCYPKSALRPHLADKDLERVMKYEQRFGIMRTKQRLLSGIREAAGRLKKINLEENAGGATEVAPHC